MSKNNNNNNKTKSIPDKFSNTDFESLPASIPNQTTDDPNKVNEYGIPILALAVKERSYSKVQTLLKGGANPNSAFYILGDLVRVREMQEEIGTSKILPRAKTSTAPLMIAASIGEIKIVELLLKYGAQINAQDNRGYTSLMVATVKGYMGVIQVLLSEGALLDTTNHKGETALHLALRYNHPEIASKFIFNHANLNCVALGEPYTGATPLIYLVKSPTLPKNSLHILHKLLDAGADKNHVDGYGMTALAYAIKNDYKDMAEHLIHAGVDLSWRGSQDEDYLLLAIQNESVNLVKELLDKKVPIEERHIKKIGHHQACNKPIFDDSLSYLEISTGDDGVKPIDQIKRMVDAKLITVGNQDNSALNYFTTTNITVEQSVLAGDALENSEEA